MKKKTTRLRELLKSDKTLFVPDCYNALSGKILDKVGEGGMGVVYQAEDTRLHRTVALKFVRPDAVAGDELKARFLREAEAAAALDHPGIVPIFEIGQHAGQHYFSMGYIEGESLAQTVSDGPLSPHVRQRHDQHSDEQHDDRKASRYKRV